MDVEEGRCLEVGAFTGGGFWTVVGGMFGVLDAAKKDNIFLTGLRGLTRRDSLGSLESRADSSESNEGSDSSDSSTFRFDDTLEA